MEALRTQGAVPADVSGGALRTFFNILDKWELRDEDGMKLLAAPKSTYYRWKQDPSRSRLGQDTLERISYVLGIYKAINILLPNTSADTWVHRPNDAPTFGGQPPIELMTAGHVADLYRVRQWLDAQRGWG